MLKKLPIYCLTNKIVERLKVSSIERLFNNIIYKSNLQNANFNDLYFDGDERLINGRQIYRINNDIKFKLNNGSSVYV